MINESQSESPVRSQTIRISLDIELCIKVNQEDALNRTSELTDRNQLPDIIGSNNKSLEDNPENRMVESSEKENESLLSFGDYSGRDVQKETSQRRTSFSQFRMFPTVDVKANMINEGKQHSQSLEDIKGKKGEGTDNLEEKELLHRQPIELDEGQQLFIPKTLYNSGPLLIPFKQDSCGLNFSNSKEVVRNKEDILIDDESNKESEELEQDKAEEQSPFVIKLGPIKAKQDTPKRILFSHSEEVLKSLDNCLSRKSTGEHSSPTAPSWTFQNLILFLEEYYFHYRFCPDIILDLNTRERVVLTRLLNTNFKNRKKAVEDPILLRKLVCDHFNKQPNQHKGYKVTNSKRFVYRKIKTVLYQNFKNGRFRKHLSKKALDSEFFAHYFGNTTEYQYLDLEEKKAIKTLYFTYEETKIHLLWRFSEYKKDFLAVLLNFKEEMQKYYFSQKITNLRNFLESVNDRSEQEVKAAKMPFTNIPLTHSIVDLYVSDFIKAFGNHLNN